MLGDRDILLDEEHPVGGSLSRLMIGEALEREESCRYHAAHSSVKPASFHREQDLHGHLP
jgi:hypothetical protein